MLNILKLGFIQTFLLLFSLLYQSLSCPAYCFSCSSYNMCDVCITGYGIYLSFYTTGWINYYQRLCQPCLDANCYQCSTSDSCIKCENGYRITSSGGLNVCQPCNVTGCQQCNSGPNVCNLCFLTYRLLPDNTCQSCNVTDCLLCTPAANICTRCCCQTGVDILTDTCLTCDDIKCLKCQYNYTQCTECTTGYGVLNGVCMTCREQNCTKCPSNVAYCEQCSIGFGAINGYCDPCVSRNCSTCSQTDVRICYSCIAGHGLYYSRCEPCFQLHCLDCSSDYAVCVECKPGRGIEWGIAGNDCRRCAANCLTCFGTNNIACSSCDVGLYLDTVANNCIYCTSIDINCLECNSSTSCTLCPPLFYLDPSGTACVACPTYCASCFYNTLLSGPQCVTCLGNYVLILPQPMICGELCGNQVALLTPCDYQLGIQYDGCTDFCQVEDGFQCRKVNYTATCSYSDLLQMKIVYFVKDEFANSFTIAIKVWPPLYVFKTSDLKGVFFINDPTFTIDSIKFNEDTNEMIFKVDFSADYYERNILIEFIPNQDVDERYYASINSNALRVVSMLYYPEWALKFSQLSLYLLYIIVGMGNFGALIGLISKRLAGLQALFVYQMAFLSIVWLNFKLYLPFQIISPLKYTNGYHMNGLFPSTSVSSRLLATTNSSTSPYPYPYPHTSQFEFDEKILLNNFNVFFALQLLCLLCYVIATIIFVCLKRRNNQLLANNEDKKAKENKAHMNRATTVKQYSACGLMYFGMINLVYFVVCGYLYLSKNQIQMINIIFFALVAFTYVMTLILFCCDPDPFDYFRYSFNKTRAAMAFYYVYPFILAASALTVVMFAETWPPIIPFAIFMLFILIYKPYKQILENYRSAFNLFVIILWLCLRVYLQFSNSTLDRNNAFVYNFINIMLLFVVMIISYVSLIYYIVYVCYLKQKQQKNDEQKVMNELEMMDVRQRMGASKNQSLIFKKLLQPRINILQFSNNLTPMTNDFIHEYASVQNVSRQVKKEMKQQRISKPEILEVVEQKKKIISSIKQKMQQNQMDITKQEAQQNAKLVYAMQVLDKQNKFIRLKNAKDFTIKLMKQKEEEHEKYIDNYNQI